MKSQVYSPRESGYYPPGAEFDPNAPWNIPDPAEKEFNIAVSCSLSKDTRVISDEYSCYGYDDPLTLDEPYTAYAAAEYTVEQIIEFSRRCAEYMLTKHNYDLLSKDSLKEMLDSCQGWTVDEENAEQISYDSRGDSKDTD